MTSKNGKQKSKRIFPSLKDAKPLAKVKFKTIDERNRYVLEKRSAGHTLRDIGDSIGLTREMIRLIVLSKSGPNAQKVRERRTERKKKEAKESFRNLKTANPAEIADNLGTNVEAVRKLLGSRSKNLKQGRQSADQRFTNEDLLDILKKVSKKYKQPLTVKLYQSSGVVPTVAVYLTRFGSWNNACEQAGVVHGKALRNNYKRAHSEQDLLDFVASYLADPRTNGSAAGYETWQRNVAGAPSLSLVRQRLGKWNEIKEILVKQT